MRKILNVMAGAAVLFSGSLLAQDFQEGQHFQRIGNPVAAPDDKVVVTDGFAYPCGACRRFLPYFASWAENAPDYVEVEHLPIALQPGWDLFVRAYYTAQVMGIAEETHEAMFKAVHDKRRQFRSFDDIADFYGEHGVDADSFVNTSQSFAVDARIRKNRNDVRSFGIRGTPAVIVQGKWLVNTGGFSNYDELLDAVDYLVEREAEALGLGEDAKDAEGAETASSEQADEASN